MQGVAMKLPSGKFAELSEDVLDAARAGDIFKIRALATIDPRLIEARTAIQDTIAHIAVAHRNNDVLNLVRELRPALFGTQNIAGLTPAHAAVFADSPAILKFIAAVDPKYVAIPDLDGRLPVHMIAAGETFVRGARNNAGLMKVMCDLDHALFAVTDHRGLNSAHYAASHFARANIHVIQSFAPHLFDIKRPPVRIDPSLHLGYPELKKLLATIKDEIVTRSTAPRKIVSARTRKKSGGDPKAWDQVDRTLRDALKPAPKGRPLSGPKPPGP
jgi:hypothetical protein